MLLEITKCYKLRFLGYTTSGRRKREAEDSLSTKFKTMLGGAVDVMSDVAGKMKESVQEVISKIKKE